MPPETSPSPYHITQHSRYRVEGFKGETPASRTKPMLFFSSPVARVWRFIDEMQSWDFRSRICSDLGKIHRNLLVFTIFRLIKNQTDVRLVPNQLENEKCNWILVCFDKIRSGFFCVKCSIDDSRIWRVFRGEKYEFLREEKTSFWGRKRRVYRGEKDEFLGEKKTSF